MEILYLSIGLLISGLAYMVGFSTGTELGFHAREFHNPVVVVATRNNDSIIVHDFTDKSFLAQANTIEELREILKNRFPEKTIVIAEAN